MKKFIFAAVAIMLAITLCGCVKSSTAMIEGEWNLETISSESGIIYVGKAYFGYDEFDGEKINATLIFTKDKTFECKEIDFLSGSYQIDADKSEKDTASIIMNLAPEVKISAVIGTRTRNNDSDISSLIFEYNGEIYSFIRK